MVADPLKICLEVAGNKGFGFRTFNIGEEDKVGGRRAILRAYRGVYSV